MKKKPIDEKYPFMPFFAKLNFTISGFGAYISWSSILAAVDYFDSIFPEYNFAFSFTIPYFIATNLFSCLIYLIARCFRLNTRIIGGLIIISMLLILLPVCGYMYARTALGFWIVVILLFVIAAFSTVMHCSAVALSSMFPGMGVSYYFTGSGLAGVSTCLLRMLSLFIFNDDDYSRYLGCLTYFAMNIVLLYFSLAVYLYFIRTDYCHYVLLKIRRNTIILEKSDDFLEEIVMSPFDIKEYNKEVDELFHSLSHMQNNNNEENKRMLEDLDQTRKISLFNFQNKFDIKSVFVVFRKILPMPILCFLIYVQTFNNFPGLVL